MPATDEKKYYTPSIEEFHVGFEYESFVDDPDVITAPSWIKVAIDHWVVDYLAYSWRKEIEDQRIRVKHLDQEDIESLGWAHDKELTGHPKRFIIQMNDGTLWVLMLSVGGWCMIESYRNVSPYTEPKGMFRGHIKNKSELKKLMQQIGII